MARPWWTSAGCVALFTDRLHRTGAVGGGGRAPSWYRDNAMATNPPSPRPLALVTGAFAGIGRALVEDHQVDLALLENAGGLHEVSPGAPEPGELGDHQLVPGAGAQQCLVKLGSPGELAGGLLDNHRLAAGRDQGVGVRLAGGDSGRSRSALPDRSANARARDAGADTGGVTRLSGGDACDL